MTKRFCVMLSLLVVVSGCETAQKNNEEIQKAFTQNNYQTAIFLDDYGNGFFEDGTCITKEGVLSTCVLSPSNQTLNISFLFFDEEKNRGIHIYADGNGKTSFVNSRGRYIIENDNTYIIRTNEKHRDYCYFVIEGRFHSSSFEYCNQLVIDDSASILNDYESFLNSLGISLSQLQDYAKWLYHEQESIYSEFLFVDDIFRENNLNTWIEFSETDVYYYLDGSCKNYNEKKVNCPKLSLAKTGRFYLVTSLGSSRESIYAYLSRTDSSLFLESVSYSNYSKKITYTFYISNNEPLYLFFLEDSTECIVENSTIVDGGYECKGSKKSEAQKTVDRVNSILDSFGLNEASLSLYLKWLSESKVNDLITK